MVAIGVDQFLSNSDFYENKCLENIKKLYKYVGKYYDQQQYKDMIETEMVSTPEGYPGNSLITTSQYYPTKTPSAS